MDAGAGTSTGDVLKVHLRNKLFKQLGPKTTHEVSLVPMPEQQRLYDTILRRHVERQRGRVAALRI